MFESLDRATAALVGDNQTHHTSRLMNTSANANNHPLNRFGFWQNESKMRRVITLDGHVTIIDRLFVMRPLTTGNF